MLLVRPNAGGIATAIPRKTAPRHLVTAMLSAEMEEIRRVDESYPSPAIFKGL